MIATEKLNAKTNIIDFLIAASATATDVDLKVGRRAEVTVLNDIVKTSFIFTEGAETDLKSEFRIPAAQKRNAIGLFEEDPRGVVRVTASLPNGYRVRITKHPSTAPATTCYAIRFLEETPRSLDRCNVPIEFYKRVRDAEGGFAVVCGKTGSGKSTSLMSLALEYVRERRRKVVILESPLEYQLDDDADDILGSIVQIEILTDLMTWEEAMELLMWIRPRLIVVGEVTSPDVMEKILALSDAGHTVLFTLHTNGPIDTVSRILSFFGAESQARVRGVVSKNLIATMSQRLVVNKEGTAQIMIPDVFYNGPAVAGVIANPNGQLGDLVSSASVDASHLMLEDSVLREIKRETISYDTAFNIVDDPKGLYRKMVALSMPMDEKYRTRYEGASI